MCRYVCEEEEEDLVLGQVPTGWSGLGWSVVVGVGVLWVIVAETLDNPTWHTHSLARRDACTSTQLLPSFLRLFVEPFDGTVLPLWCNFST